MGSIHRASLVDSSSHSPVLLEMLQLRLDRWVIGEYRTAKRERERGVETRLILSWTLSILEHLVSVTIDTVELAMGQRSILGLDCVASPLGADCMDNRNASLTQFIMMVIHRSQASMAVLLVAIIYIQRAKPGLCIGLRERWDCERIFLGALIIASKYLNDSPLRNSHWAICSGCLGNRDIGFVEREFLQILDWKLAVEESDILAHQNVIRAAAEPRPRDFYHQDDTVGHYDSMEQVAQAITRGAFDLESPVSYWSDSDDGSSSPPKTPHSAETLPYGSSMNLSAALQWPRCLTSIISNTIVTVREV